ncbi:MAG: PAS domain-containing protein [Polyangiaceae bacterium]|nr:PAS domain-containing protein [Polyangiaceae bacterium]
MKVWLATTDGALEAALGAVLGAPAHGLRTFGEAAAVGAALDREVPDLVVLDAREPQSGSLEVASRVRVHPLGSTVVLLALCDSPGTAAALLAEGVDDVTTSLAPSALGDRLLVCERRHVERAALAERRDAGRDAASALRDVVAHLPDYIVTIDRAERIVFASRGGPGGEPEELVGGLAVDHLAPEQRDKFRTAFAAALATGQVQSYEADSHGLPWAVRVVPVHHGSEVVGVTLIASDLSERRRMEAQVRRTDRIAALGTLAAGLAHEINNPLGYVMLNLTYLQRRCGEALALDHETAWLRDAHGRLESTLEGVERIRRIVHDLRVFSRGDDGPLGAVDVVAVLDSAVNVLDGAIRHRARLVRSYADAPFAWGHQARLAQVFVNVLLNAVQALPEGGPELGEITVSAEADARGRAVVTIADTGEGIAPEVLGRIFDPFFTTKASGVGTGLGLWICERILAELGGEIAVASEPGRGTRVTVVLPAVRTPGATSAPPEGDRA